MGGGPGLQPLEFTDCLTDSPYFREKLHVHEKELDRTSQQIKRLVKEVKDLLHAANQLSKAQRTLSKSLISFDFECIGASQTDEEVGISHSLREFGEMISRIEDERGKMLERAHDQIIRPLENFRKQHIGNVKDGKKKFDKETAKFCLSQERYLNLSSKKQDSVLKEADAALVMEQRCFFQASLEYVFLLQEVQERKKFEFVETLMGFMYGWLTFYHEGHEVATEFKPYMQELQFKIQKTRENFNATRDKTETLMKKMLEVRQNKSVDPGAINMSKNVRVGYLVLMEKRAFGTTWTKHYCTYHRETKTFEMIPYNQMTGKFNSTESMVLSSCVRRMSDSIEKRFCFDVTSDDKPGIVFTLQAFSEEDRKLWMDVMDGKEPTYAPQGPIVKPIKQEERPLDEIGFTFVRRCIEVLRNRGLEEQGLYRVVGVTSKVTKLLQMGLDRRKPSDQLPWLDDVNEWESKTITSSLKTYLRNLPEPLMTFRYHSLFIEAAKLETRAMRVNEVHSLIYKLPKVNRSMLDLLVHHLKMVANRCEKNLMTVSNLGVCFGPTLLRPEEESVAAILEIKFCNVVVEILIENYEKIFKSQPEMQPEPVRHLSPVPPHSHSQAGSIRAGYLEGGPSSQHNSSLQNLGYKPDGGQHSLGYAKQEGSLQNLGYNKPDTSPQNMSYVKAEASVGYVTPETYSKPETSLNYAKPERNLGYVKPERTLSYVKTQTEANRIGAYSESNLLSMNQHNTKTAFLFGSAGRERPANTSSSNESISSDHLLTSSLPPPNQRGSGGSKLGIHYATSYRPADSMIPRSSSSTARGRSGSATTPASLRRVRTLYTCLSENDGELSFEPNQIITNVRPSLEPGWLEGTLNGKTGLVPENYVEFLP